MEKISPSKSELPKFILLQGVLHISFRNLELRHFKIQLIKAYVQGHYDNNNKKIPR